MDSPSYAQLMKEVRDKRISLANEFYSIQLDTLEKTLNHIRANLIFQFEKEILQTKDAICDEIKKEVESLYSTNKQVIDQYLALFPQKQKIFSEIRKFKSTPVKAPKVPGNEGDAFETDFLEIKSEMSSQGIDVDSLFFFSDGVYLLKGQIMSEGCQIAVTTRTGYDLIGIASVVKSDCLHFQAKDGTTIVIPTEQISNEKVRLRPISNK